MRQVTTVPARSVRRVFRSLFPSLYAHMSLMRIDYLVYSGHKTATQTIRMTLHANGYRCTHCHHLGNTDIRMDLDSFRRYLERYKARNGKRLDIITVFREPVEKLISSFFQSHGTDAIQNKYVADVSETILSRCSVRELQEKFIHDLDSGDIGRRETLYDICRALNINVADLDYDEERGYGLYETERCRLFILRFDTLIRDGRFEDVLSSITGKEIHEQPSNVSDSKWYADVYSEFKASLEIPHTTVQKVYEARRDAIDVFYPGEYESLLDKAFERYG